MSQFIYGETSIHYQESGAGFPVLLLAPGGMDSTFRSWPGSAIQPLLEYVDEFQLVAMDQRNAGDSTGPLDVDDPWGSYCRDQLALMDHLGFETFSVIGACIGVSFALKLIELAPSRVVSGVLLKPIGVFNGDCTNWQTRYRSWGAELQAHRADVDAEIVEKFGSQMWKGDFVVSVTREFLQSCPTPLLVCPGADEIHPIEIGRELAAITPNAELLEPWSDTPERVEETKAIIRTFLKSAIGKSGQADFHAHRTLGERPPRAQSRSARQGKIIEVPFGNNAAD